MPPSQPTGYSLSSQISGANGLPGSVPCAKALFCLVTHAISGIGHITCSLQTSILTLDVIIGLRYYRGMIKTFRCPETERVFNREFSKKLPHHIQRAALRKLRMLNRASVLSDLRNPPSNRLESLTGDRKGQYSMRINDQWRVCFRWQGQDAYDVEIVDYH